MSADFSKLEKEILSGHPVTVPEFLTTWLKQRKPVWVGGVPSEDAGGTFETINPATEEVLSEVAEASQITVARAVKEARLAFEKGDWSQRPIGERAQVIRAIGDLILKHRAPLAILESLDTGKPLRESFDGDIPRAAQNFQFFADFGVEQEFPRYDNATEVHTAFREPLGVVALITPWNLPLYLETWKLAPALLMGNSVLLKPSELTPLTAAYLAELVAEVGLPKGVFSLLHGLGEQSTGQYLVSHPGVDAISFTGETRTGRAIMRDAAVGPTRVSFELGGKGALVVFDDADVEKATEEALRAGFRNQGEICLACPRIFVARKHYEKFVDSFVAKAKAIVPGNPLSYETRMGALIGSDHYEKVKGYVERIEAPARILCGGARPGHLDKGYFLAPTVVTDVSLDHPVSREEVFGPVVSIYPFDTDEEAIAAVNSTPYGLSASIWTSDEKRADRVAKQIRIGLVWVNCWFVRDLRVPFGGQKRSGVGREGGRHSLDFFSEWKSVCVRKDGV